MCNPGESRNANTFVGSRTILVLPRRATADQGSLDQIDRNARSLHRDGQAALVAECCRVYTDRMALSTGWPRLQAAPSWRERSVEERAQAIEAACRAAVQILAASTPQQRQARLARVDPVPPSTRALLRRLAAQRHHA